MRLVLDITGYSEQVIKLLVYAQGGTHTMTGRAMLDLGCFTAQSRIDTVYEALAAPLGKTGAKLQAEVLSQSDEQ